MEKVLAIGAATVKLQAVRSQPPSAGAAEHEHSPDKALACAILFVEIRDYGTRSVADQLLCKQRLNSHVACALEGLSSSERIVLDTEAGIAVSFLGSAHTLLPVLRALLGNIAQNRDPHMRLPLHGAINLGPVRVAHEPNGHVNIVGDGISVAQRLLAFAQDGQILLARTFVEAVLAQDPRWAALFVYQGSRTDVHVRDHEVFELDMVALARAGDLRIQAPGVDRNAPAQTPAARRSRHRLVHGFGLVSALCLAISLALYWRDPGGSSPGQSAGPLPAVANSAIAPAVPPAPAKDTATPAGAASSAPPSPLTRDEASTASLSDRAAAKSDRSSASAPLQPKAVAAPSQQKPVRSAPPRAKHATTTPAAAKTAQRREPGALPAPRSASAHPARESPQPWRAAEGAWPVSAEHNGGKVKAAALSANTNALVTLAISPWGEVFVDGRSVGVSPPLRELELSIGKHRVTVRNGELKPFEQELELTSNQTVRIRHKFAQRS
jgi:hypothetical protein